MRSVLRAQPERVIVAAPVGSREACQRLRSAEPSVRCICALEADMFSGVGAYYEEFEQVSDEEVMAALG